MSKIGLLSQRDKYTARAFIGNDPLKNLFLHAALEESDIETCMLGMWKSGVMQNVLFAWGDRSIHLTEVDVDVANEMADYLARWHAQPYHLYGPRAAVDLTLRRTMWQFDKIHSHVLMKCFSIEPGDEIEVRVATKDDMPQLKENAVAANVEDLGVDPLRWDESGFTSNLLGAVLEGRVYLVEEDGEIIFQMVKSYAMPWACHVGGVYTCPSARGRGLATMAMRSVCKQLLRAHNTITLEVREGNHAAVSVYKKLGFTTYAPMRMALRVGGGG